MRTEWKFFLFVSVLLLFQCKQAKTPELVDEPKSRFEQIMEARKLRVVTDYNSTSYFLYRGQPLGYQYELLQELSDFLNLELEVVANNNLQQKFDMVNNDEVDLIAVNLTVTKERRKELDFTTAHTRTRQVLVQKKPDNWRNLSSDALNDYLITDQLDLGGKKIYVQRNSTYSKRLKNLSDEVGDSIHIIETDIGVEELIAMVSSGEIGYTVSDENVAMVNETYYNNLDISLPVSFAQNLAWAVKKGNSELKDVINAWLTDFKKTKKYAVLYRKYFKNSRYSEIVDSDYFTNSSGSISPYDIAVKKYSEQIGWDWRLVSSMIYQESRFNPNAQSWAGAFGLMQLMPRTASQFGVSQNSSPEQQVRAGVLFLSWLDKRFEDIEDPIERQKFILASYNVGPGHVMDAQRLAEKYGDNPKVWTGSVDDYILLKSKPEYYSDSVVKYGYCRGVETYKYVSQVLDRYEHYKNLVD